ncbi:hypothetical protein [Elioraea sp.]|uniref:hypothetical protein n=1 Tax=Elioraea sp. TaxID=2185103 RepID=UPI003F6F83C3
MNTLWAAMLSAWLAAGQATPAAAAPDRPESPGKASQGTVTASGQDRPASA